MHDATLLFLSQTADQLLARADAAKALAEEAAKKGQSTFREAESILEDLRGTVRLSDCPTVRLSSTLSSYLSPQTLTKG